MINLQSLRPRDASPAAIADALSRVETAGRGVAAEMTQARGRRDALLVIGSAEALASAEAELRQLAADGDTIMSLHAELTRLFKASAPSAPAAAEEARLHAVQVAAEFAQWWSTNAASMQRGLQLLASASEAMARWHGAALPALQAAPPQPSNVVTLPMQPPGAA